MGLYPPQVANLANRPDNAGPLDGANAIGTAASFVCGSFVRFLLIVENSDQRIGAAKFQSNGCGYMIAAAGAVSKLLSGKDLRDLHGMDIGEMLNEIEAQTVAFPADRIQCGEVVIEALKNALAEYRRYRIEEFQGEKALICTCFGVSEETISKVITESHATDVSTVSAVCRAGSGCGSCQMLIREMIDTLIDHNLHEF